MALRATKPAARKPRLRCLIYGPPGVGKTTAAIQFPNPYVIDAEGGTDHYADIIERSGGAVWRSSDAADIAAELRALTTEKHPYKTLVIDPITTIWDTALDLGTDLKGDDFGKHTSYAKRSLKSIIRLIEQIDMNVVLTSHEQPKWQDGKEVGTKPSGFADLPYFADVVFQLTLLGKKRIARVEKCRPSWFEDQARFEWSFEAISDAIGPALFAESEAIVLADDAMAERMTDLCKRLVGGDERLTKFLRRHKADHINEIPADQVAKAIAAIESEIGA